MDGFSKKLISVIIPHRTDRQRIICMDSLTNQTYKNLEIIVKFDVECQGAPVVRNNGFEMATGDYVFFCDDDIILKPDALEKMATVLDSNPEVGFVYCDYLKKGTVKGRQNGELFSKDLLKHRNYAATMSLVRREAFQDVGRFDEGLARYQDWDLWLRITGAGWKGYYIPEALFTAFFGKEGISSGGPKNRFKMTHRLKKKHNINEYAYSVIIPIHNEKPLAQKCLETVLAHTGGDYEVILVDDCSGKETADWIRDQENIGVHVVRSDVQLGHTGAVNLGAKEARGQFLCFLNSDTLVSPQWNFLLAQVLINNMNISAVGPLTSSSASLQQLHDMYKRRMDYGPGDIVALNKMVVGKQEKKAVVAKITGFCFVTTSLIWEAIGEFDPEIPAGGNEADWLIRGMDLGLYPAMCTAVYVHHYGNQTYGKMKDMRQQWNHGNQMVVQKHGQEKMDRLELELFMEKK